MKIPAITILAMTLGLSSNAFAQNYAGSIDPAAYDASIHNATQIGALVQEYEKEVDREDVIAMIRKTDIDMPSTTTLASSKATPKKPAKPEAEPPGYESNPSIHDHSEKEDQEGERRTMPFYRQSAPIYTDHGNNRELVCPPGTHRDPNDSSDLHCLKDNAASEQVVASPDDDDDDDENK